MLVDSSAWVDFLSDAKTTAAHRLAEAFEAHEHVFICGLVMTEVLQGIRTDREYADTLRFLRQFDSLSPTPSTYELAARIYRDLRKHGETIRGNIDCIIAALSIETGVHLLVKDRNFAKIAKHCPVLLI